MKKELHEEAKRKQKVKLFSRTENERKEGKYARKYVQKQKEGLNKVR